MALQNYTLHKCPISQALGILGGQWTLLIARDLMNGVNKFDKLQRSLKISRNLLTQRLRKMEEHGLAKKVVPDGLKRAIYLPTKKCIDLTNILLAFSEWSEKWMPDPEGPRVKVCDCENGEELKLALLPENEAKAAAKNDYNVTYLFD